MSTFPLRTCPVCQAKEREVIFRQEFASYSEGTLMPGYDVAVCTTCGAGYADDIPNQSEFDRYYADMSKYEHSFRDGRVSDVDVVRFAEVVDLAGPHVKATDRIIDVGCATGALLAEFKRRGYSNLKGYDPSVSCSQAAQRLYGLDVAVSTINGLNAHTESADLVIMTGVLEHLADVDSSLNMLKGMLVCGGMIYLEVPDASRYDEWFSAPYQFFSMEHVNFFSPQSLTNLMGRHGFTTIFSRRVKRFLSPQAVEPAIAALFSWEGMVHEVKKNEETAIRMGNYIAQSSEMELRINSVISAIANEGKPLAIWGAGTHTLRLMLTSDLSKAKVVAILDSNSRYHGKSIHGFPIISPQDFDDPEATILISSQTAENEIKHHILEQLGWSNELVCLYQNEGTELKPS
jgi:SAM-dependent methyltransferase